MLRMQRELNSIHVIWTSVLQTAPKEVVNLLSAIVSLNNSESN